MPIKLRHAINYKMHSDSRDINFENIFRIDQLQMSLFSVKDGITSNRGPEGFRNLPEVTQLAHSSKRIQIPNPPGFKACI